MAEVPLFVSDSNSALRWLLPNREYSAQATSMIRDFAEGRSSLIVPYNFHPEVGGGVRQSIDQRHQTYAAGRARFMEFLLLDIPSAQASNHNYRAFENCQRFGVTFLDSLYVTVAGEYQATLITTEVRLMNALRRFPYKMFIADYRSPR